jgi:putative gamma-glutamyltranspeptidase
MKGVTIRLFTAALALTLGLAGCGPVDGEPIRSGASAPDSVPRQDAVTVAQLRQQAEQNGSLAVVLYLGSVPERTADVDAALDSLQEQPWQFVMDIPADHRVTAPGGGRELYCLFAVCREDTLFVYEKQDPQYPHQTGRELYCRQGGQPILLLCNGSPDTPDTMAKVYCSTGRPLDWTPQLSGSTGQPMPVEGVDVFSNHPASGAAL